MPSKSKSQQRFFGMVDAYKKGEMKNASSKIKKAAKGMSMSDVKDFAETKHKGLPEKVEEQTIIRLTESDLHKIVKESVNRVLNEIGDTPKGQYMLGKLTARQEGNNDRRFLNTSHYAFGKRADAAKDELNNTNGKQKWVDSFNDLTDAYNSGTGYYEDRIAQDYYKKKGWQ